MPPLPVSELVFRALEEARLASAEADGIQGVETTDAGVRAESVHVIVDDGKAPQVEGGQSASPRRSRAKRARILAPSITLSTSTNSCTSCDSPPAGPSSTMVGMRASLIMNVAS